MQHFDITGPAINRRRVLGLMGATASLPFLGATGAWAANALPVHMVEQPFATATAARVIDFDADYSGALLQLARHLKDDRPELVTGLTTQASLALVMQIARDAQYRLTIDATQTAANGMTGAAWRLTARGAALTA